VQATKLGTSGGSDDWNDKPATEVWSEQEQHKKARARSAPVVCRRQCTGCFSVATHQAGIHRQHPLAAWGRHCVMQLIWAPFTMDRCLCCAQILSKGRPDDGWPGIAEKQVWFKGVCWRDSDKRLAPGLHFCKLSRALLWSTVLSW
jgi:hypothetical protein